MARLIPKTKPQLPHYGATKNGCELNRNRLMRRGQDSPCNIIPKTGIEYQIFTFFSYLKLLTFWGSIVRNSSEDNGI